MAHRRPLLLVLPLALAAASGGCKSARPGATPPPPTVTWEAPTGSSNLHGVITVSVAATGATPLSSLKILEPTALAAATAVLDAGTRSGRISTTLDLSSFADGSLTLVASATDDGGRTSSQSVTVTVAQTVPTISLVNPSGTSTALKGNAVLLTVSATAANGATITQLQLVNPPTGVGPNTSPSASLFTALWDTTRSLEGPTPLHFRTTDSAGLTADQTYVFTVDNVPLGAFDVRLSAGNPIQGASVTVYALDDATGAVLTAAGTSGVLGTGGPTDAAGRALVTLSAENYTGPVRVVASGSSLQYVDPAVTSPLTNISIPSAFTFSSILPTYATGSGVVVPLTLFTTLADHEVLAFAAGKHAAYPTAHSVSEAIALRDQLFVTHIVNNSTSWPVTGLRTTVPTALNDSPRTLVDTAYAAFFDVALNVLGHDTAFRAGYSYSSTTINAVTLAQLLEQDLDADAQFDGKGSGGASLVTTGATPVTLDAQFLRVPLATSLDNFIYDTSLNKTGLTRNDLTNAGVYDTISTDASDLFGAPPSGSFDNAGPTSNATVTYSIAGGPTNASPVGVQAFVAGTLAITADASDPSGVASISVKANGNPVTAGVGSTASHFVGTWNTPLYADGPLAIAITATDTRHNVSTTTVNLIVDNTAPALAIAAPSSAAWYSTSVPVDASASDTSSGVASLALTGLTGFVDLDSAAARVANAWTIPGGTADGLFSGQLHACDVVGNCINQTLSFNVDRTPPALTLVGTMPTFTNLATLPVVFTASDGGAGVSTVNVRDAGPLRALTFDSGTGEYSGSVTLNPGANTVTFWGTDFAISATGSAPNSGDGLGGPYGRSYSIVRDTDAPVPTLDSTFATYFPETNMTVGVDANGDALFPAQYVKDPAAVKTPLTNGAVISKVQPRLSWSSAPTAAQLEDASASGNPGNIPTLRFVVPYDPTANSPITAATYSVTANCSAGCSATPATGDLLASSVTSAGVLRYLLPLSGNTVPSLLTGVGDVTLSVVASFTDAAGNVGSSSPFTYTYRVLGAPLAVREDTAYAMAGDSRSTYPYKATLNNYFYLFDTSAGAFLPDNVIRIVRYVVTNPSPQAVALTPPSFASTTWSATEQWTGTRSTQTQVTLVYGGQGTCRTTPAACQYFSSGGDITLTGSCTAPATNPPASTGSSNGVVATLGLSSRAYLQIFGTDNGVLSTTPGGSYLVPAATSANTKVSLYIVRAVATSRAFSAVTPQALGTYYDLPSPGSSSGICQDGIFGYDQYRYTPYAYNKTLNAASETLTGSFAPTTVPLTGALNEFGLSTVAPSTLSVARTITH
jgi:hypothetical protein